MAESKAPKARGFDLEKAVYNILHGGRKAVARRRRRSAAARTAASRDAGGVPAAARSNPPAARRRSRVGAIGAVARGAARVAPTAGSPTNDAAASSSVWEDTINVSGTGARPPRPAAAAQHPPPQQQPLRERRQQHRRRPWPRLETQQRTAESMPYIDPAGTVWFPDPSSTAAGITEAAVVGAATAGNEAVPAAVWRQLLAERRREELLRPRAERRREPGSPGLSPGLPPSSSPGRGRHGHGNRGNRGRVPSFASSSSAEPPSPGLPLPGGLRSAPGTPRGYGGNCGGGGRSAAEAAGSLAQSRRQRSH